MHTDYLISNGEANNVNTAIAAATSSICTLWPLQLVGSIGTQTLVKLVYYNGAIATANANTMTVKATLVLRYIGIAGCIYMPVFFGENRNPTLAAGAMAVSDPIAITNSTNLLDVRAISTFTVPNGGTFACKLPLSNNYAYNADYTDSQTDGQDVAGTGLTTDDSLIFAPGPIALLGNNPVESVAAVGDSIAYGFGVGYSFINVALNNSGGTPKVPVWNVAQPSETIAGFLAKIAAGDPRLQMAKYCTRAVVQYGINDLYLSGDTAATIEGNLSTLYADLVGSGVPTYQTTITPASSSTDSWATTTNQTADTLAPQRALLNNWIRTKPYPLSGFIEIAGPLESGTNTSIWQPNMTFDGIHPNAAASTVMSAAINPTPYSLTVPQAGETYLLSTLGVSGSLYAGETGTITGVCTGFTPTTNPADYPLSQGIADPNVPVIVNGQTFTLNLANAGPAGTITVTTQGVSGNAVTVLAPVAATVDTRTGQTNPNIIEFRGSVLLEVAKNLADVVYYSIDGTDTANNKSVSRQRYRRPVTVDFPCLVTFYNSNGANVTTRLVAV